MPVLSRPEFSFFPMFSCAFCRCKMADNMHSCSSIVCSIARAARSSNWILHVRGGNDRFIVRVQVLVTFDTHMQSKRHGRQGCCVRSRVDIGDKRHAMRCYAQTDIRVGATGHADVRVGDRFDRGTTCRHMAALSIESLIVVAKQRTNVKDP
jgi:hypothetical protein